MAGDHVAVHGETREAFQQVDLLVRVAGLLLHDVAFGPVVRKIVEGEMERFVVQVLAGLVGHGELGPADEVDGQIALAFGVFGLFDVVGQDLQLGAAGAGLEEPPALLGREVRQGPFTVRDIMLARREALVEEQAVRDVRDPEAALGGDRDDIALGPMVPERPVAQGFAHGVDLCHGVLVGGRVGRCVHKALEPAAGRLDVTAVTGEGQEHGPVVLFDGRGRPPLPPEMRRGDVEEDRQRPGHGHRWRRCRNKPCFCGRRPPNCHRRGARCVWSPAPTRR